MGELNEDLARSQAAYEAINPLHFGAGIDRIVQNRNLGQEIIAGVGALAAKVASLEGQSLEGPLKVVAGHANKAHTELLVVKGKSGATHHSLIAQCLAGTNDLKQDADWGFEAGAGAGRLPRLMTAALKGVKKYAEDYVQELTLAGQKLGAARTQSVTVRGLIERYRATRRISG